MNLQRTGAPIVVTRTGRRPLARFQHIRPPVGCNIIFVVINRGAMRLVTCSCLGEGCRSGQLEGCLTLGHCKWLRFDNRDSFTHTSMGSNLFSIYEGIQDGNRTRRKALVRSLPGFLLRSRSVSFHSFSMFLFSPTSTRPFHPRTLC